MKIEAQNTPQPAQIETKDIPVGTVFYGEMEFSGYTGHFLKTFDGLVLLDNPQKTWSHGANPAMFNYRVAQAKLVVEKYL